MDRTNRFWITFVVLAFLVPAMRPVTGYAQDDDEEGDASGSSDRTAQLGACADACLSRTRSGSSASLATCIMTDGIPECHGLEPYGRRIWDAVCDAASRLQAQCDEGPPASIADVSPDGAVSPARSATHRPRRLVLECRHPDGSTFEATHDGHSSWRDQCVCGDGFVGVSASRYAETASERARLRRAEARGEVHRIVQCLPRGAAMSRVEGTREALDSELARRVSDLEAWRSRAEPQLADHEERLDALEARDPGEGGGLGEDAVRRIVDERVEPIRDRLDIGDVTERDVALSQRIDALTHTAGRAIQRLWNRSAPAGNVGVRLEPLFLIGFSQLSVEQGSHVPLAVGGELDLMISLGNDWFLEAGLGIGYAFRDEALPDAMQGVYHAGAVAVIERVFGFGFGAILTERYGDIPNQAFTSDHTVIGGYLEGFGVIDLGSGWAFTPGARVFGGAGLRFDENSDAVSPDGGLMLMLGFSYFGGTGGASASESAPVVSDDREDGDRAYQEILRDTRVAHRTRSPLVCDTPNCRDTAIGRVQVP